MERLDLPAARAAGASGARHQRDPAWVQVPEHPIEGREVDGTRDQVHLRRIPAQDPRRGPRLAKLIEDQGSPAEVLAGGIGTLGHQDGAQTGPQGRAHPVVRVLQGDTGRSRQAHALQGPGVDVRRRLLLRDHVAGGNDLEPVDDPGLAAVLQQGRDVLRGGGGRDPQTYPGGPGLPQEPQHPGTQRDAPLPQQIDEVPGLAAVQIGDEGIEVRRTAPVRAPPLQVVAHALLAAGDGEELAVEIHIPMPVQAGLGEGGIEGRPVTVTLGIGQGSIDIEQECRERDHNIAPIAFC